MQRESNQPTQTFHEYPTNHLVGVLDTPEAVSATLGALHTAGFPEDAVQCYCKEDGARRVDFTSSHHQLLAKCVRVVEHAVESLEHAVEHFGDEGDFKARNKEELSQGHFLVEVKAAHDDERHRAREILKDNGAHFINYFGRWCVDCLDP
ncbi:MAG TPA: hypothetical protein VFS11_10840 [Gemmatimonadales bacterium]|nr:hypothetical protein [Gemmatimonadales bacterium]